MKNPGRPIREVTWDEYDKLVRQLATKIDNKLGSADYRYFIGIPRGGLPIAVHLSHLLKTCAGSYPPHIDTPLEQTIIVDDICDSGKTMKSVKWALHNKPYTASLFRRKGSEFIPDYYVELISDEWIVFPWEI